MTLPTPSVPVTLSPPLPGALFFQAAGSALLTGAVSAVALFVLIRAVLATGVGISILATVLGGAAITLALLLRLMFRRLRTRSGWPTAVAITAAVAIVYFGLSITGTQKPSIVSLRPEVAVAAVSLASGAVSTIAFSGWWRVLGIVGGLCLLWLALTPVIVAI